MPRDDYQERVDRRRERLEDRADKQSAEATRRLTEADRMSGMMNGQPILIGHHSEKRHRRDLDKMHNNMHKSVQLTKEADELEEIAEFGIDTE